MYEYIHSITPCSIQQSKFHWCPLSPIGMFHKYAKWSAAGNVDACEEKR